MLTHLETKLRLSTVSLRYAIEGFFYRHSDAPAKLALMKDSLKGQPLLVVGNGPSLNRTPLDKFIGVPSIGMNKINLIFDRVKWRPSFIVCANNLVVQQNREYFIRGGIPTYIAWKARWFIPRGDRSRLNFYHLLGHSKFAVSLPEGVGHGHTVTYSAIQFAYYLAADPVIIVGVDHSYKYDGQALQVQRATGPDINHFDPNYFAHGQKWGIPDLHGSENDYRAAKKAFEAVGRRLFDATVGGNLRVFDRIEIDEAMRLCKLL